MWIMCVVCLFVEQTEEDISWMVWCDNEGEILLDFPTED